MRLLLVPVALAPLLTACAPVCDGTDDNLVVNGTFDSEFQCWVANGQGQERVNFEISDEAPPGGSAPSMLARNDRVGNSTYDTQLLTDGRFRVEAGQTVDVSFMAKAEEERTVWVWVQECCDPSVPVGNEVVTIGTDWAEVSTSFTAGETAGEAYFEIQFGEVSTAGVWVDDIVVSRR